MMRIYAVVASAVLVCCTTLRAYPQIQLPGDRPRLIVQIVVGQMRSDYLQRFRANFADEGFRTFINDGSYCNNARYHYMLTQTAPGLATIATGTSPSQHGITSDTWFDRVQGRVQTAMHDREVEPIESSNSRYQQSPRSMLASTFGDELRLLSKDSRVYGVAFDSEAAILLPGHNVSGAFWVDEYSGKIITNNYYMEGLPAWVQDFNNKRLAELYALKKWETKLPLDKYSTTTAKRAAPTGHLLIQDERRPGARVQYADLAYTPFGDNLIKDFVTSLVINERLGKDASTDLLCVYFASPKHIGDKYGTLSVELEDAVYRIDEYLNHFVEFLNHEVGKANYLLVLTSDHGANLSQDVLEEAHMPSGIFESNKAMVLLKSYLNVVYGKGEWVKAYHEKQVFLNRHLIEDSNLNLAAVQQCAADFILQFSGVANVATASTLSRSNFNEGVMRDMQNGFFPKRSGDVIINLNPGWVESASVTNSNSPYSYDVHVPLAFYGWKIKRKRITTPVSITDIAPTMSTLVGIPTPNASQGTTIPGLID